MASLQSKTVLTDVYLREETTGFGTVISKCKNCVELFIHKINRGINILFAIGFLCIAVTLEDNCMSRCINEKSNSNLYVLEYIILNYYVYIIGFILYLI